MLWQSHLAGWRNSLVSAGNPDVGCRNVLDRT